MRATTNQTSMHPSSLSKLSATLRLKAGEIGAFIETECDSHLPDELKEKLLACCAIGGKCVSIVDSVAGANLFAGVVNSALYDTPNLTQALDAALQATTPTSPQPRYVRFHQIAAPGRRKKIDVAIANSLDCAATGPKTGALSYEFSGLPTKIGSIRFRTGPKTGIIAASTCKQGLCDDSTLAVSYQCKDNAYSVSLDYVFEWEIDEGSTMVSLPLKAGTQTVQIDGVNRKGDPEYPHVEGTSVGGGIVCQWSPRQWRKATIEGFFVTDTPVTVATQTGLTVDSGTGALQLKLESTACNAVDKKASIRVDIRIGQRTPSLGSTCDYAKACGS